MLNQVCWKKYVVHNLAHFIFSLNKKLFIQVILACCLQFTLKHEKITEVYTQH